MSWVWVWPNFKISLVRGSYELPIEQIKQTVNANHGQPVSQLASKPASESVSQRAKHPASQPASESVSQPASQSVKWVSQSSQSVSQSVSQPTDQPTITLVHGSHEQPIEQTTQTVKAKTNQLTSQPTNRGADLPNYSHREEGRDPKSCFKIAQTRISCSLDSQISQTVYLSLHLQNHMGFRFGSSWGVVEHISKSHW